jgi:hypothetical protein
MQIARLPKQTESSASSSTTGTPCRASPIAEQKPTGPAPTTTTGRRWASHPSCSGGNAAGCCAAVNG